MPRIFQATEAIEIKVGKYTRVICQDCVEHEQGDVDKVYDCKNVFINNQGESIGQCCCYSKIHGIRE